jgi:membrane protein implicated in regulation of membrane protease activity
VNIVNLIILLVILILPMLFTFWAIRDVVYGQFPTMQTKYIWLAVVTLLPVVGALVYLVAGRSQRRATPTS